MVQMEDEPGEALPYWDWTEDKDVPDLWEEIRLPMKPPLKSEYDGYGSKGYGHGYGRGKEYGNGVGHGGYNGERSRGDGEGGGYKSFVARKPNVKINVERLKREVRKGQLC